MWDEQVLATTGGAIRQQAREAARETVRDTTPAAAPEIDAEPSEIVPEPSLEDESEILTPSS
jgi:hypothetical protein